MSIHSIAKRGRQPHESPAVADSMEVGMRRHASCLLALTVALIVWCTATLAHADSLVIITSGSFSWFDGKGFGGPGLTLFGTNGFSFIGGAQLGVSGPGAPRPGAETRFSEGGVGPTRPGSSRSAVRRSPWCQVRARPIRPVPTSAHPRYADCLGHHHRAVHVDRWVHRQRWRRTFSRPADGRGLVRWQRNRNASCHPLRVSLGPSIVTWRRITDRGVPEPSTIVFTGTALLLLGMGRKRLFGGRQHGWDLGRYS
jgi:hypothetical protein